MKLRQSAATILVLVFTLLMHPAYAQQAEDYFRIAAENNPGLQARYKAYQAALQEIPQARSLPDPGLSFGYFLSPVETRVGPQRARFSLSQMFPWFGTLKARGDAAALSAEAKFQAFLDARNKLYYQVAAAYYPLYELKRWKAIEQENINILRSYKTVANANYQNGNGSMVDVLRVDMMLNDAHTNLDILNSKEKPLIAAFNKLLNRAPDKSVEINDTPEIEPVPEEYRRDSLLTDHPALNELDMEIRSVEARERAAKKQGLPKLGVGLDYVIVDVRTVMELPDNGQDVLMPMISVSIPIFRNKYKAAVKEAQLQQDSYVLQRKERSNSLVSDYERIQFEIQKQAALISLYNGQIRQSEQSLNLLFTTYSNSGKAFEEVLRMQQQLLKYQKMKATAMADYRTAKAELDYITAKSY
ncbi:MAG: TolC family protein [Bacteroidetes bacterium]|nr:TolC family protein [Bacteroidota bacterium]